MPSPSLDCFTLLPVVLLLGGVSPAAGQNNEFIEFENVFPNRAALLVARDAWCADPTAAAAIYGPINLWDISQVTDLSYVFSAASSWTDSGSNPACSSFNSDISGWDVSGVTTLYVRAASPPLHPSPLTRTLCLAFAYHSLCRVQGTFHRAEAFNQPLEAWNVAQVTTLAVRAASRPLLPSPLTRTRCASLLLTIRFAACSIPFTTRMPSTNPSRRGTSHRSQPSGYAPPLILSTHPL